MTLKCSICANQKSDEPKILNKPVNVALIKHDTINIPNITIWIDNKRIEINKKNIIIKIDTIVIIDIPDTIRQLEKIESLQIYFPEESSELLNENVKLDIFLDNQDDMFVMARKSYGPFDDFFDGRFELVFQKKNDDTLSRIELNPRDIRNSFMLDGKSVSLHFYQKLDFKNPPVVKINYKRRSPGGKFNFLR